MRLNSTTSFIALSLLSMTIYAEAPIQAGDTLESLSKVRIQTTVNGQPGSIQELVSSGQIQLINEANPVVADPPSTAALPTSPQAQQSSKVPSQTMPTDESQTTPPTGPSAYSAPPDPTSSAQPVTPGDIIPLPQRPAPSSAPDAPPPLDAPVPSQQPQDSTLPPTIPNPEQPDVDTPTPQNIKL